METNIEKLNDIDHIVIREQINDQENIRIIPVEAIGVRMELLDLSSPGEALDVILNEPNILTSENIYADVYEAKLKLEYVNTLIVQTNSPIKEEYANALAEHQEILKSKLGINSAKRSATKKVSEPKELTKIKTVLENEHIKNIEKHKTNFFKNAFKFDEASLNAINRQQSIGPQNKPTKKYPSILDKI